MSHKYQIYYFLGLSTILHIFCLALFPGPDLNMNLDSEIYQLVAMMAEDETIVSSFSENQFEEHVDWLKAMESIEEDEPARNTQDQMKSAHTLFLPQTHFKELEDSYQERLQEPILDDTILAPENELALLPAGLSEIPLDLSWNLPSERDKFSATSDSDSRIASYEHDTPQEDQNKEKPNIEGPVASRAVIYKPSLPTQSIQTGAIITLKFWVFPDGTVGKIIPLKKGDAHLEQIATNYVKQWRFTPLPKELTQEDQWGIIPVKFKVY